MENYLQEENEHVDDLRVKSIVHIHTDHKFIVANLDYFNQGYFKNYVIFLGNLNEYKGCFKNKIHKYRRWDIKGIVNFCKDMDLVVLYNLDVIKREVVINLPSDVKIAWRFFGLELYSRMPNEVFTTNTLKIKNRNRINIRSLSVIGRSWFVKKFNILFRGYSYPDPNKVLARVNFMMVLSEEEYVFLSKYWSNLPKLIKLPHPKLPCVSRAIDYCKKDKIIIGNNRSPYNNHFDVIKMISTNQYYYGFRFELLFNYGRKDSYYWSVKQTVSHNPNIKLIEDFIHPNEFEKFYEDVAALVINGYRQMAGRNIYYAIQYGAKVYLSMQNPHYQFLINEGFIIFTIDDFEVDLKNVNFQLSKDDIKYNLSNLEEFQGRYNENAFCKCLYQKLIENEQN